MAAADRNKEIGQKLNITEHTVKAHVKGDTAEVERRRQDRGDSDRHEMGTTPRTLGHGLISRPTSGERRAISLC